jgi:hypothetical protein
MDVPVIRWSLHPATWARGRPAGEIWAGSILSTAINGWENRTTGSADARQVGIRR